jgi:hypothetical protein
MCTEVLQGIVPERVARSKLFCGVQGQVERVSSGGELPRRRSSNLVVDWASHVRTDMRP